MIVSIRNGIFLVSCDRLSLMDKILETIFKAVVYLFVSVIVYFSYKKGIEEGSKVDYEGYKIMLKALFVLLLVSFVLEWFAGIVDNCDMEDRYGQCQSVRVVGFSVFQMFIKYIFLIIDSFIPFCVGLFRGRNILEK